MASFELNELIYFVSDRLSAQAAALAAANAAALGADFGIASSAVESPDISPRTITLQRTSTIPPSSAPPPAGGLKTIGGLSTATLTLDVFLAPQVHGIPQRLSYAMNSRQSIVQTALGAHVSTFGLGIGRVDIDCLVLFQGAQANIIDKFFGFMKAEKQTTPFGASDGSYAPPTVKLHDSYLSRSYVITTENMTLTEDAEEQGRARLHIGASILQDYSQPVASPPPTSSASTQELAAAQAAAQAGLTLLSTLSPGS